MSSPESHSLFLVTGANGFLASHIIDQILKAGHHVRGTVRSESKAKWLHELFDSQYPGRFTTVVVPDLARPGACDEVVKGVTGVAHVASEMSFSADPEAVIPGVINSVVYILESAAKEKGIKRFVLTSSSTAALLPKPNTKITITEDSWNEEAIKAAWAPAPYLEERRWSVYAASKAQGEQAMWKFMDENKGKASFEAHAVLPNANFGPLLNVTEQRDASTAGWITSLYGQEKMEPGYAKIPPQYYVNATDTALLHLYALTSQSNVPRRIFAFAAPWNWNIILSHLRKIAPDVTFPKDLEGQGEDLSVIEPAKESERILREMKGGKEGWMGLEESLRQNIKDL